MIEDKLTAKKKGFTLIELMLVTGVIGILAAITVPRFSDLVRKTHEGATKGNLGALRSAIKIYYANNEGRYPRLIDGIYKTLEPTIDKIPEVNLGANHYKTDTVDDNYVGDPAGDTGHWFYDNINGNIYVNCTHNDTRQKPVSTW
jgi:prepilin-type N-terminal cleavage/methylation domain-containing protein